MIYALVSGTLALLMSIILSIRYNSISIFFISIFGSAIIIGILLKYISKLKLRNLLLFCLIPLYIVIIAFPMGEIHKYESSKDLTAGSAYNKCQFCKKVRVSTNYEGLDIYIIEPDGIGLVYITEGSRTGFCSMHCAELYNSIPNN